MAFRGRRVNRPRELLDLPRVKPDAEGRVSAEDLDHYTRTLLEWSRGIQAELDSRAVVDERTFTFNSATFVAAGPGLTDMTLPRVPVRGGIYYGVHVNSTAALTGAGARWAINVFADNLSLGRVGDLDGDTTDFVDGWAFWTPKADAITNILVTFDNIFASGSLILAAIPGIPRSVRLIGFGPAPPSSR